MSRLSLNDYKDDAANPLKHGRDLPIPGVRQSNVPFLLDQQHKKPSVFDRLGSKGANYSEHSEVSTGFLMDKSRQRRKFQRSSRSPGKTMVSQKSKKGKSAKRQNTRSETSDSSSEGSSSTSISSSSSDTVSSSSSSSTSSSTPSVKLPSRRKRKDHPPTKGQRDRNNTVLKYRREFQQHQQSKARNIATKDTNSWKKQTYQETNSTRRRSSTEDQQPRRSRISSPNRKPPTQQSPDSQYTRRREREFVDSSREQQRFRLVPPDSRRPPSEPRARQPMVVNSPQSRKYQNPDHARNFPDYRDDKYRMRDRSGLTLMRNNIPRIPPLIPENLYGRPTSAYCLLAELISQKKRPLPLFPDIADRRESLLPSPTKQIEKTPLHHLLLPMARRKESNINELEKGEVLSDISDDEDDVLLSLLNPVSNNQPLVEEKEEVEVTSTLVDEGLGFDFGGSQTGEDSIFENMDFEEISEEEFEEEATRSKSSPIVLGADWSILLKQQSRSRRENRQYAEFLRRRYSTLGPILKKTGLSQSLVSPKLYSRILEQIENEIENKIASEELINPLNRVQKITTEDETDGMGIDLRNRELTLENDRLLRLYLLGMDSLPSDLFDSPDLLQSPTIPNEGTDYIEHYEEAFEALL